MHNIHLDMGQYTSSTRTTASLSDAKRSATAPTTPTQTEITELQDRKLAKKSSAEATRTKLASQTHSLVRKLGCEILNRTLSA